MGIDLQPMGARSGREIVVRRLLREGREVEVPERRSSMK